jgi:SAM-dependent methyltransferase/uncharacterized protein YbaR (Trm112 family)
MPSTRLPPDLAAQLICPACKTPLGQPQGESLDCPNPACANSYPVIAGCPVLINEANSVFSIADYRQHAVTTMDLRDEADKPQDLVSRLKRMLRRIEPPISMNVNDFSPDQALAQAAEAFGRPPRTLVIGAGDAQISPGSGAELVYSDVAVGPLTQLVCDAHDIPFADASFDAVVANSVLEHVADPYRCVDEIHRVLRPDGFVYAVTPFMQQVHMGRYDFTRFTHLGHRRLFRRFDEERSGITNGQATVLAWALERYFAGFSDNPTIYARLRTLARFIGLPFLLFDRFMVGKRGSFDAASAYYFSGRRSEQTLSDREIIRLYRGMHP